MKRIAIFAVLATTAGALAAADTPSPAHPRPADLQPLETVLPPSGKQILPPPTLKDVPPPPPVKATAGAEPEITVVKKGEETIEETRIRGRLFRIRVTPAVGAAYTLVDPKGDGNFIRAEGPELRGAVPAWVLLEW